MAAELHYREYGAPTGAPPIVLLHGLFGSSANWRGVARRLEADFHLLVPDLRNHGQSPHLDEVAYETQVGDVTALLDRLEIPSAILVGHSMGGKVAMQCALTEPDRVETLVCVDISPDRYPSDRFGPVFDGLRAVDPATLKDRRQADERLAQYIDQRILRNYLLQNLVKGTDGWRWRLNLQGLERGMEKLSGFDAPESSEYLGDTLFLYGGNSPYLQPHHPEIIHGLFPFARMRQIAGAGHWVYAERPGAFVEAIRNFLSVKN